MAASDIFSRTILRSAKLSEDLLLWQSRFLKAVFFLEDQTDRTTLILPLGHQDLREDLVALGIFDAEFIERLDVMKTEVESSTASLINTVFKNNGRPEKEQYDRFSQAIENYAGNLRWLERDLQETRRGIDPETGFKIPSVMFSDLVREQDRRARRGKPFSIVLARIDHYKALEKKEDTELQKALFMLATKSLRMSLRSFDDIYRLAQDEFLIVLKQTDLQGALRFSERIREIMSTANLRFDIDGLMQMASISFCVAEPLPGEDLKPYINHIRKDMNYRRGNISSIAQFQELSPLERIVKDTKVTS